MTKDLTQVFANANSQLLPFFEQAALASLYDNSEPWEDQRPGVAATVISIFKCPSSTVPTPIFDPYVGRGRRRLGLWPGGVWLLHGLYGRLLRRDGVKAGTIPPSQQGMFNIAWGPSIRQITDGTSRTIAIGDIEQRSALETVPPRELYGVRSGPQSVRTAAHGRGRLDYRRAQQHQVLSGSRAERQHLRLHRRADEQDPGDRHIPELPPIRRRLCQVQDWRVDHYCKPSYEGGSHSVSNYRSDHPGGCNFAFADGSATFLNEGIDLAVYRAKSTIAGDEVD